jgi:hypothetical protein
MEPTVEEINFKLAQCYDALSRPELDDPSDDRDALTAYRDLIAALLPE